jgi:hypothetical protein
MLVRPVYENAKSPILVTLSSIIIDVIKFVFQACRHAVVPSFVLTVSVTSDKIQPSPVKISALTGIFGTSVKTIATAIKTLNNFFFIV